MDLELQESDIVFTDQDQATPDWSSGKDKHDYYSFCNTMVAPIHDNLWACGKSRQKKAKKKKMMNSPPVDVPETFIRSHESNYSLEEEDNEGEVVPPHLIIGQRMAARMASSVCFSHGRTLKGRYLSEVRDSILKMTGFLES